jgi:hypothetical protein
MLPGATVSGRIRGAYENFLAEWGTVANFLGRIARFTINAMLTRT